MGLNPAIVLADAWAAFRRDRDLLLTLAGVFWFLPALALALFVPGPPPMQGSLDPNDPAFAAWSEQFGVWAAGPGLWYVARAGIVAWGQAALFTLLIDPSRPDVRGAIGRALMLWPRFILLTLLTGLLASIGLLLWVLPAIWVLARLMAAGPALIAERPIGVLAAMARGYRLSSGVGLPLMALVSLLLLFGWLLPQPFVALDIWLRTRSGGANVVAVTLADALLALAGAASALASALVAVAAYRRLLAR